MWVRTWEKGTGFFSLSPYGELDPPVDEEQRPPQQGKIPVPFPWACPDPSRGVPAVSASSPQSITQEPDARSCGGLWLTHTPRPSRIPKP